MHLVCILEPSNVLVNFIYVRSMILRLSSPLTGLRNKLNLRSAHVGTNCIVVLFFGNPVHLKNTSQFFYFLFQLKYLNCEH